MSALLWLALQLDSRDAWEKFREPRLAALRASLGEPLPPADLKLRATGGRDGDGFRVENVVFESRPGLTVTANLYLPAAPAASMPGILICHSHHAPKSQGELQQMGILWARAGCLVLVMDQLGHGERRQHPFADAASYRAPFRVGRQDYYFRYVVALQLHLVGESLIGWMAGDLSRGVDVLLARGADAGRIILLGAVAGGGDPAAVAAALDPRIAAAVVFNFGGPQPETRYPLPEDAERTFDYAGSGSWESTRNLRLSVRDGFLPWVIVGSIAPRRLVYAHEFSWDRERDPVWKRLQTIWSLTGAPDRLASAHGRGLLSGKPPEATHCTNIGAEHRREIYTAFEKWFGIRPPAAEPAERFPAEALACGEKPRPARELAAEVGRRKAAAAPPDVRRRWAQILGPVDPPADLHPRVRLHVPGAGRHPVVVATTPLKGRDAEIDALLKAGVGVCIPEIDEPRGSRGRGGEATARSATALMHGETVVGRRLRELRAVLRDLRGAVDPVALWGDSAAPANAPDADLAAPMEIGESFPHAEPIGDLLALIGALFEEDVRAVYTRGGLASCASILESPFVYVPHDAIVPGAVAAGDLDAVVRALPHVAIRRAALVDGLNRRLKPDDDPPAAETLLGLLKR